MFKWNKLGKLFTPQDYPGKPWLKEFAQAPATLVFDNFIRIYFSCRPESDVSKQYVSYSSYIDVDKEDPFSILNVADSPILPLGKLGEFDEFGTYPVSVTRDKDRILAYYAGWTRCDSVPFDVAIGVAESFDDGKTFKKIGAGPVLGASYLEPFVISGPKIRRFGDKWFLYYIAGRNWKLVNDRPEPVYKIRLATSVDGLNWKREDRDLIPSRIEEDEAQASPDVFFKNGKYHMFFCYRKSVDYRNHDNGYRIGYAYSQDGYYWHRDDSRVGIDVADSGWDAEMISYPHIFELDDKIYMAYLGNQVGKFGFGLAQLDGSFD